MNKLVNIFQNLTNLQKVLVLMILGSVLYSISASVSYSLFRSIGQAPVNQEAAKSSLRWYRGRSVYK